VHRWLDLVGLDPESVGERLGISPACGLAGATPAYTRTALALCRTSAVNVEG
jgi:hypothetical protein